MDAPSRRSLGLVAVLLGAAWTLPLEASPRGGRMEKPPQEESVAAPSRAPAALRPMEIPEEAKPPVETLTVEVIGLEGIEAFQRGNFEGAREAYLRVLKIEPNNLPALVNLGAAEFQLGNFDEAERALRRSLQIKTDNPAAWLNLGILYLERGETMQALAAVAQAAAHDPSDAVARNYLGVAAGQLGWFDAAEAELRRAVEIRPDYADAHFNLAVFCLERDPPAVELARRHYRRALDLGAAPDPLVERALK